MTFDPTGEAGEALTGAEVYAQLGWIYRKQPGPDYGVDGQIELVDADRRPTGRLVGVQVKSSDSQYSLNADGFWVFRPEQKHLAHWLQHTLPMFVFLVDLPSRAVYWQAITNATLQTGPRGGVYISVPAIKTLATAAATMESAASVRAARAANEFVENLNLLPPKTRGDLLDLRTVDAPSTELLALSLAEGRTSPGATMRSLLTADASWLQSLGAAGFAALGSYGMAHAVGDLAADAFVKAADLQPTRRGERLALAGAAMGCSDRARALFEQARDADDDTVLADIGLFVLDQPDDRVVPFDPPQHLLRALDAHAGDVSVVAFRAQVAFTQSKFDESVSLWGKRTGSTPNPQRSPSSSRTVDCGGRERRVGNPTTFLRRRSWHARPSTRHDAGQDLRLSLSAL